MLRRSKDLSSEEPQRSVSGIRRGSWKKGSLFRKNTITLSHGSTSTSPTQQTPITSGRSSTDSMDGYTARKPSFRNLQPRSAAAMDFNDSDDDQLSDQLSADYKAQRKTTLDLVDFFKNAPPPPSPPRLPPMMVDDKKKRTLLQRLRSRKSGSGMGGASAPLGKDRENRRLGTGSTISTASNYTVGKGGEVATLPNGKKYIMIAVDYKRDQDSDGTPAVVKRTISGSSSKRLSRIGVEETLSSRRQSVLNTPVIHVTTTIQEDSGVNGSSLGMKHDGDKRRSIVIQAGGGEGASFILDNTPFLLDNFALDTDFIMAPPTTTLTHATSSAAGGDSRRARQSSNGAGGLTNGQRETHSTNPEQVDNATKRTNKVQFNIREVQQSQEPEQPLDEDALSEALSRRIATHKANMAKNKAMLATSDNTAAGTEKDTDVSQLEIVLPKPVSRKKVRHVQIQTQHCIMRPMCTQTEPIESLVQDLEIKEFGTQTMSSSGTVCGSTSDCGTSTEFESTVTSSSWSNKPTVNRANSKVASLVASLSQPTSISTGTGTKASVSTTTSTAGVNTSATAATATTETGSQVSNPTSSTLTISEQEELVQLRQERAALQVQVACLKRDLAAETRARTRTAVAMQDTRDKFELLSAMAYKKIKEMIFQRHVLEMEVRELRAQVDLQAEDGAESYQQRLYQQQLHQHQLQQQHQQQEQQDYVSVGHH
ncbi:hypothetical protein BGZ68_008022 [Mortierella alpina]|nr:hypothetical protein BGZ68_008022 [Mortierella alpina]